MAVIRATPVAFTFDGDPGDAAAVAELALRHCALVAARSEREPDRAEALAIQHQKAYQQHLDGLPGMQRAVFAATYTAACAQFYQQRLGRQQARFRQRLLITIAAVLLMAGGTAWWAWG